MDVKRMAGVVLGMALLAACVAPPAPATESSAGESAAAESSAADSAPAETKLNVVSTVSPLVNIIYNIGGDRIQVSGIIPEGTNSHTFEPAPSDAQKLAEADLILVNGLKLEEPTMELAEASKQPDTEIISMGDQTITPDEYIFDFSFPESEGSPNPHLWVNPMYALRYAEIARDALVAHDPDNADYYNQNYDAFKAKIEALDAAIKETVASIPEQNRKLLTYHDSFAYFAPVYGMTVIGAIQPSDFAEPSAKEVADLITQVRDEKVPAIFGSEVFPSPVLDQIAAESGVQFVDTLRDDDLPGAPGEANHSYLGMMVEDLRTMAAALGGNPELIADFDTTNVPGQDNAVQQPQ